MTSIDQVSIKRRKNAGGREFDQATLWIAGVPFSTDLTGPDTTTERIIRRIAAEEGIDVDDYRPAS